MVRIGRLALAASLIALVPLETMAQSSDFFRMPTSGRIDLGVSFEEIDLTLDMAISPAIPALDYGDAIDSVVSTTNATGAVTYTIPFKPSWVQIDADTGRITGTPPTGNFSFRVRSTDSTGARGELVVSGSVAAPAEALNIVPSAPISFKVGRPINYSFSVTNGDGAVTWQAPDRPGWMTLTNNILTGTPTTTDPVEFDILAFDSIGKEGSYRVAGEVAEAIDLSVAPQAAIADWTVAVPVSVQFTTSNNVGAVTYSATGLPTGLTLTPAGLLSGTPVSAGPVNATITANDSDHNTGTYSLSNQILPPPVVFDHTVPTSLPIGSTTNFGISLDGYVAAGSAWVVDGPSWLSVTYEDEYGVYLGGTVGETNPGNVSLTISTTDSHGRPVSQTFTIAITQFTVGSYGNISGWPKQVFTAPTVNGSTSYSFTASAELLEIATVDYNTGALRIRDDAAAGTYGPFTVTVRDTSTNAPAYSAVPQIVVTLPELPVFTNHATEANRSTVARLNGVNPIALSVTDGEFRVCGNPICTTINHDWRSAPLANGNNGNFLQLRPTGDSTSVTLTVDGRTTTWTITP